MTKPLIDANNVHLWEVWGYPEDPNWDEKTYDIGYTTDSGTGSMVACDVEKTDAEFMVEAARFYDQYLRARELDKQ